MKPPVPPRSPSKFATTEERIQYRKDYQVYRQAIERYANLPFKQAQEAVEAAKRAGEDLRRQEEEQFKLRQAAQQELSAAERESEIASKRSTAISAQLRSRSLLEQQQTQQSIARTAQTVLAKQRKQPGTSVGQPRRTATRVSSALSIGGYGGARAARVSPTGLNI